MRRLAAVALAVLVSIGTAGCGTTSNDSRSATAGLPDTLQRLAAHEWTLDQAASTTPPTSARVTFAVNKRHVVTGQAECNTYSGLLVIDGDTTRITHLFSSDAPCDAAAIKAEREYFDALARIDTADTTDPDRLVLKGGRSTELVYEAQGPRAELAGSWRIRKLARDGELAPVLADTSLVATFGTGGGLEVRGSCNALNSSWTLDAPSISIDPPRSTRKTCDEPAGVMAQEAALSSALESAAVVDLSASSITLFDSDGDEVLTGTRQPPAS